MKYIDLRQQLQQFAIFSLNDIRKLETDFDRRRLVEWQQKAYIKKIIKGYYIFADFELSEKVLFTIANKIYKPSYISLEMALSYYNLIPEAVYSITSVSSKKTTNFKTEVAHFTYQSVKPELMFAYEVVKYGKHSFLIAEMEKAFLDYLYLNSDLRSADDYSEWRLNIELFKAEVNLTKLKKYLKIFNNQALKNRIEDFLTYAKF